jgi:hypothetical protein
MSCATALAAAACDDVGQPPSGRELNVTVVSPNGAEGAAVLETTAPGIVGVASEAGDAFFSSSDTLTRIVVILDRPGALRFTLSFDTVPAPPALLLVEVADGANNLRDDLADYEVVVERR